MGIKEGRRFMAMNFCIVLVGSCRSKAYRSWRAFVAQAGNRAGEFWVAKVSQRAFVALAADLAGEFLVAKVCLGEFWETCSLAKVCLEFCQDEHYYHSHTFALKVQRIVALLCLIFGEN